MGDENQQACLQMTGIDYIQSGYELQTGDRRVNFNVLFDFPRLEIRELPIVKTIIPTYDIKE